jgi:hypothetical protein
MSIKKHYRRSDTTETWSRLWYYMIVHNLTSQVFNSSTTHCPDSNCDLWGLLYEITQDQCNLISVIKISLGLQCFIWITSDNQTNIRS